ncbi:MAG TPA: undecaprenyl-diphosphatase UppP, partial [Actinomycetota bacterium]|nr:undecaprenyl-diphosphatase UppP [Actinomycetota bacterium]
PRLSILQAIVLGLIQGATEFAPVSSSGHLILVPWAFGWEIVENADLNKSFDVALHIGTLVGALLYFRRDVVRYTIAAVSSVRARSIRTMDERVAWAIAVGTIPGVIVGASLERVIQDALGAPWLIAVMLAVFGVVLYVVDHAAAQRRDLEDLQVRDGLFLGVAQALALQPGVSRSGITITAARAMGFDRETAARFSFLLSLPIIAGAGVYKGVDLLSEGIPPGMGWPFVWGMASSAVSGFLVIWFLLRYLRRHDFAVFMWYRLAVAAAVFTLIGLGIRAATI